MSEWRPIGSAHRDGRRLLLYRKDYAESMAIGWWSDDFGGWEVAGSPGQFVGPTHWMNCPEPPAQPPKSPADAP